MRTGSIIKNIKYWELPTEVEEKYFDKIQNFLNTSSTGDTLDLTGTELNPSRLQCMLEHFDYKTQDRNTNGWEMDFEIYMSNNEADKWIRDIMIQGCGMTFMLKLVIR